MARFRPMPFEQWQQHMLATTPEHKLVDCPDCNATGYTDCCECGSERECDSCEDGKVPLADLSERDRKAHFNQARYLEAVLADAVAWGRWLDTEPAEAMASAGYVVASRVRTKALEIVHGAPALPRLSDTNPYDELAGRFANVTYQQATLQ